MSNEYYSRNQTAIPGTTVRSKQFNGNNDDIANGFNKLQDPDMLASGAARYAIDTGTVENQYVVTVDFKNQVVDYIAGMNIRFKTDRDNTGSCQISVNGLDKKLLLTSDGYNLSGGQIPKDSIIAITYDGSAFRVTGTNYRDVRFDIDEKIDLTSNQSIVIFSKIITNTSAFYIEGDLVDRGRLSEVTDYEIINTKTIQLRNSYPQGTSITGVSVDATSSSEIFTPVINAIDETVTITGKIVNFSSVIAEYSAFYIDGDLVDRGRLLKGFDYSVSGTSSILLINDYPAGTKLTAVMNEALSSVNAISLAVSAVTNLNTINYLIGAEYNKYTEYGTEKTPLLIFNNRIYQPLSDIGSSLLVITGPAIDNQDGTITTPTDAGDIVFSIKQVSII